MNQMIIQAIDGRRRMRFVYNGKARLVEPQCYGMGTKGNELLRAHQVVGGPQPEPLFDVSKIEALAILDETFDRPGPHYHRGDSAIATIFRQL